MVNIINTRGVVNFNPRNLTKKHDKQGDWKTTAIVELSDYDICNYYMWFIKKRHGLDLLKPQRGPHVTIVADRTHEISNFKTVVKCYNKSKIRLTLDLDARTDGKTWWLNVTDKDLIHGIRSELGLDRPFFGLHMTIGSVRQTELEHGRYIHTLYKKGYAN